MSIEKMHLSKLLKLMYLPDNALKTELRKDIRAELKKVSGESTDGGGDFYQPFWYDVKQHVLKNEHISISTKKRIDDNYRRKNLYPKLEAGFLTFAKRGDNQDIILLDKNPKGKYLVEGLNLTIKVENIMCLSIGGKERLGYPYLFSMPPLTREAARVGLWVMERTLNDEEKNNMRIFDVMRSEFFSLENCPLDGDEKAILLANYRRILRLRNTLLAEY